jgi:peptide/nickel transport system permease protein
MGTDSQGRDEYSRVLYGAQVSLLAGVASVVMGVAIGGTIGALAGGVGGKLDSVLMRFVDVISTIPQVLLAIGIVAFLGRGCPDHVRRGRRQRADLRPHPARQPAVPAQSDYITAARSLGASVADPASAPPAEFAVAVDRRGHLALATAIIDVPGWASSDSARPTRAPRNGARC